jgi:hypothetical protein
MALEFVEAPLNNRIRHFPTEMAAALAGARWPMPLFDLRFHLLGDLNRVCLHGTAAVTRA